MPDEFGQRMKTYELPTRHVLPPRTYTIIRVDGRAFHTYLRNAEKPFDRWVIEAMDQTALMLCHEIAGARFAYTQSDEISVLLTDLEPRTEPWFGGVVQKIASISAAVATATFNRYYDRVVPPLQSMEPDGTLNAYSKYATFDGRVYTIPSRIEVANYFLWRQKDAIRNAISMAGQAEFSQPALHGISTDAIQDQLWRMKGINFKTAYSDRARRGGVVVRKMVGTEVVDAQWLTGDLTVNSEAAEPVTKTVERPRWISQYAPDFTLDNGEFLALQIPQEPADALQPGVSQ